MDPEERRRTKVKGVTYHHRILWSVGGRLIQHADEDPDRRWYGYFSALLVTFFAFEGFLNYIGEELYPREWEDEKELFSSGSRRGTKGKLEFLAERLAVPLDRGRRPYQSLSELSAFRHTMVHSRHDKIDDEIVTSLEEIGRDSMVPQIASKEETSRIRSDVEKLADGLFDSAKDRGLHVTGESGAMTGTLRAKAYDDIP